MSFAFHYYLWFSRTYVPQARLIREYMDWHETSPESADHGRIKIQKLLIELWFSRNGLLLEATRHCDDCFVTFRYHYDHRNLPVLIERFDYLTNQRDGVHQLSFDNQKRIISEKEFGCSPLITKVQKNHLVSISAKYFEYRGDRVIEKSIDEQAAVSIEEKPYDPGVYLADLDFHKKYDWALASLNGRPVQRNPGLPLLFSVKRSDEDGTIMPRFEYEYNTRGHYIKTTNNTSWGIPAFIERRIIIYYDQGNPIEMFQ